MIKVEELQKSYNRIKILEDISFTVNQREILVLYGRNGEGKTTLLKCIIGWLDTDKGSINLQEAEIGIVLNNGTLIDKLTVQEYLKFICVIKKIDKTIYLNEISKWIDLMDLGKERNKRIENISNGTKSKLKLIAAFIFSPKILLLDEPFLGMDLIAMSKAIELIKSKSEEGCAILIATHNIEVIKDLSASVLILKNSKISNRISQSEITKNKNDLKSFLIDRL